MTGEQGIVHPAFADAARAAAKRAMRRGSVTPEQAELVYTAAENGLTLGVRVESTTRNLVREARHDGADDAVLVGIVDVFCQSIEGLPLREAADHGTIHALDRLREDRPTSVVAGILTPRSAGSAFGVCDRLIRRILADHETATKAKPTDNFWIPALSKAWRGQSADQRLATLQPLIEIFRTERQLEAEDFYLAEIEKTQRIIVGFGPRIGVDKKPPLLREFERQIRKITGDRLEVYMEEMKDDNALRRLGPTEPAGDVS